MGIILIPDKDILSDMIDNPTEAGTNAEVFDKMIDIKSIMNCEIFIPSQVKIELDARFTDDHKASFYSLVDVDYSTDGLADFNSYTAYNYLNKIKARNIRNKVIFVAINNDQYQMHGIGAGNFRTPGKQAFIDAAKEIIDLIKNHPSVHLTEEDVIKIIDENIVNPAS